MCQILLILVAWYLKGGAIFHAFISKKSCNGKNDGPIHHSKHLMFSLITLKLTLLALFIKNECNCTNV